MIEVVTGQETNHGETQEGRSLGGQRGHEEPKKLNKAIFENFLRGKGLYIFFFPLVFWMFIQ